MPTSSPRSGSVTHQHHAQKQGHASCRDQPSSGPVQGIPNLEEVFENSVYSSSKSIWHSS